MHTDPPEFDPKKNYVGFDWAQNWFHPPFSWLYSADAFIHDQNYTIGGTAEDRLRADIGFFWRMVEDTKRIENWKTRRRAVNTAILYYRLVRLFGWIAFKKTKSIDKRRADYISLALSKRHDPKDEEQIIKEATDKFNKSVL
jgi:hypothetical protein